MAWRCFLMSALVGFAAGGAGLPGGASSPLAPDVVPATPASAIAGHPAGAVAEPRLAALPVALPPCA
ncbi:MAG TPA: hypothetical protein VFQ55_19585, partial [Casimicrobiaceae bacterium]|nr:hypothetical protein [Casimicrobiaceae bacterium]